MTSETTVKTEPKTTPLKCDPAGVKGRRYAVHDETYLLAVASEPHTAEVGG